MKKILLPLIALTLTSSVMANELAGVFAGATIGGGSGSVSISSDTGTYTFIDGKDGVSTNDFKIYGGYNNLYLYYQGGTISPDTQYLDDLTYTSFGAGFLAQAKSWEQKLGVVSIMPEGDFEIGVDSVTGNGFDATGLLISLDAGVAVGFTDLPYLSLTAGVGYDIHVVNDSTSTAREGSWNFTSLNANIGARVKF
jgi:hypothetical protein